MSHRQRYALSIVFGLLLLGGLAFATLRAGWPPQVATVGALLVLGPLAAMWMVLVGSLLQVLVRWAYAPQLGATREPGGWLPVAGIGLANAVILSLSLLAGAAGQRLLRLINELLEIARLEAGALPLNRQLAQPGALLSAAARRLQPAAHRAAIRLTVAAAPQLPGVLVDLELMGRVLDNLGDNAIKFAPDGSQLHWWTRPGQTPGTVLFGAADEGPGIPLAAQPHLFEKFNRVPNINGRREGTGLGLAFCRLAVESHHGHVAVTSQPGRGSTFAFSLPAAGAGAEAAATV